ncbi:hypothetical protein AAP_04111 [Ascosphaera apis ARSEF 7405]|uniref:Uncharacterized protein n=1 Tax=Ascosphaera apis ARSEF 7405 TaxID=392613 RepID=A0A166NFU8_9EURO|nr:hypothetical protein AAP_04111 [Ascosphaera apis ARSEF 7405]
MGPAQAWNPSVSSTDHLSSQHEDSFAAAGHLIIEDITDIWTDEEDGQLIIPDEYEDCLSEDSDDSELRGHRDIRRRTILACSLSSGRRRQWQQQQQQPQQYPRMLAMNSHAHMNGVPTSSTRSTQSLDHVYAPSNMDDMNPLSSYRPKGQKRKADSSIEDTYQVLFPLASNNTRKPPFSEDIALAEIVYPKKRLVIIADNGRFNHKSRPEALKPRPARCAPVFPMHHLMGRHITSDVPVGPVDMMDLD